MNAAVIEKSNVASALRAAEGSVRIVFYAGGATPENPIRRIVPAADVAAAVRVAKSNAEFKGAFRADVERVIDGHWSLVGRRPVRGKYEDLTAG